MKGTEADLEAKARRAHQAVLRRDARKLRRAEIEHAMRCIYRDPRFVGDVPVAQYLGRIHYLDTPRTKDVVRRWLRQARVDPLCPVDELSVPERDRLVWAMLRWLRDEDR